MSGVGKLGAVISVRSDLTHSISDPFIILLQSKTRPPGGLVASCVPSNVLYAFLFSPVRATCPVLVVLFYFITMIITPEELKL